MKKFLLNSSLVSLMMILGSICSWADGAKYYVVGTMNGWSVNDAYEMVLNAEAGTPEYKFTMDLTTTSEFKVVKVEEGQDNVWYPDGMGNNYGQNGEITADGKYDIYFRPNGDGGEGWFYNYIYVAEAPVPTFDFQNNNGGWSVGNSENLNAGDLTEENPITMDGVTLTGIQGTATLALRYFYNASKGNHLHISKGNSIKLTAPEGKYIVKVEFTMQNSQAFNLAPSTGELADNVWTGLATEITFGPAIGTRYVWAINVTVAEEELTDLVVNGTFDQEKVIAPWKTTGGFQNQTTANNQSGAFGIENSFFFENWHGSAKVNKMYQEINNIPNGTYILRIAAFVNNLADPNESQYVYANNDKVFLTTGTPTAYEVTTVVTDNKIEIGLEQTTATANWMGIDNVSLSYIGPKNQFVKELALMNLELKQSVKTKNALQTAYDTFVADESNDNKEALKAAIEATKESANSYALLETGVLPDNGLSGWTCTTFVSGQDVRFQVNTWSNEGNSDGTGMVTPFIENWTPKANVLGVGEIYYSLPGLDPGIYQFSALIRAYSEAGNTPTGASLFAGNREKEFATGKSFTYNNNALIGIYDTYAMAAEVGEDGVFRFGIRVKENRNFNWMAFKSCKVAYVGAAIDATAVEELAATMPDGKMNADVKNAAETAIATAKATPNLDNYEAAAKAITAAEASVAAYKNAIASLDAMKAEMDNTNVYTEEAYNNYNAVYTQKTEAYEAGTLTDAEANSIENPQKTTGHKAANIVDNFLLSAWDTTADDFAGGYYINTWSTEGANDGSNFIVPFFEYWVSDANALGEKTMTATMENLPAGDYTVTAWVRVRVKNGAEAPGTGITLQANEGETVNVCAGDQVGTSQMYLKEFTAEGTVGEDGKLLIKFIVAAENNISWLAFKNVKFEKKAVPASYYLVGSMNEWAVSEDYKMIRNTAAEVEEYSITKDLKANDELKIVKGEKEAWYPEGMDNNYVVAADGNYTIYFRPDYNGGEDWYYNVIYVALNTTDNVKAIKTAAINGTIYNLNGQQVQKAQKGLYIVNGKKVVIK